MTKSRLQRNSCRTIFVNQEALDLIKKKRKVMGYSQRNLAEVLGISAAYWNTIERGTHHPSADVAEKMIEMLDLKDDIISVCPGCGRVKLNLKADRIYPEENIANLKKLDIL